VSDKGSWSWLKHFALVLYFMAMVLIPACLGMWGSDTKRMWPIVLSGLIFALMLTTLTWGMFRD
jgi:hypothetical protein